MSGKEPHYSQLISFVFDLFICATPAFIIFYLTDTNDTFGASGPVTILSVIYLFYGVISLILSKGQTAGEVLLNIRAVKIKTGKGEGEYTGYNIKDFQKDG